MLHYLLNGLPIIFGILILVLPLLDRNRTYRTATLFAALNAGIVSILFFADILNSNPDFIDTEAIAFFTALTLPALYLASLLLGATVIAHGTLNATNPLRTVLSVAGGAILYAYLTPLLLKAIAILLLSMRTSGLGHFLRPVISHETVALAISTAASAIIIILICRRSRTESVKSRPESTAPKTEP